MSVLLVEQNKSLKNVCLNRPERGNSLNAELVEAMLETIENSSRDGTRIMVLQGAGDVFCTGFDLTELESMSDQVVAKRILIIERMLQALHHAPFMTVSLVKNKAFGAGADMVCCCQRRIAESGSRFCMPGLNFGILLGTRRLVQRIGVDNALSVLTDTRVFGATEALGMGFLTQVAAQSEWVQCVRSARKAATAIHPDHIQRMYSVVLPDTRAEDMEDLKASVEVPDLVDRIIAYRNSVRTRFLQKTG